VVICCGGPKEVGQKLWPAKSPEAARTRLLDCLNPDRQEKLGPDEIILLARLGRDVGCHAILEWLNDQAGYAAPVPVDPDDTKAELQRQFIGAVAELGAMAKRIEKTGRT
jgi:hypothetical protein